MVFNTDHMPWELRGRNASEGIWEAHRRSGIFMGVDPHALVRNPSLAQGERGCDVLRELSGVQRCTLFFLRSMPLAEAVSPH